MKISAYLRSARQRIAWCRPVFALRTLSLSLAKVHRGALRNLTYALAYAEEQSYSVALLTSGFESRYLIEAAYSAGVLRKEVPVVCRHIDPPCGSLTTYEFDDGWHENLDLLIVPRVFGYEDTELSDLFNTIEERHTRVAIHDQITAAGGTWMQSFSRP